MSRRLIFAGLAVLVALMLVARSVFVVDPRTQAIVLGFGAPVRVVNAVGANDPGLHFKAPWQTLVRLDKANQGLDAPPAQLIAADRQALVVQPYLRFRITQPVLFYQTLGDQDAARARLETLAVAVTRDVLGQAPSGDILAGRRDAVMQQATAAADALARREGLGVTVLDLRLRRADLPQGDAEAIYKRMRSDRAQAADAARAVGDARRRDLMATADRAAAAIATEGDAAAQRIRADGDAQRAMVFADSFGRDPAFATFYRAMQAYDKTLTGGATVFVLSPDSDFLKDMKRPPAAH